MVNKRNADPVLGNNQLTLRAMAYEGSSYLVIKKSAEKDAYTGPVEIAVSLPMEGGAPLVRVRVEYFTDKKEEEFRFSVPFAGEELLVLLRGGDSYIQHRIKTE